MTIKRELGLLASTLILTILIVIVFSLVFAERNTYFRPAAQGEDPGNSSKFVMPIVVRSSWPLNTEIFRSVGDDGNCHWYDWVDEKGYWGCPENVRVPTFWTLHWENRKQCWPGSMFLTGQPEARLTDPILDVGRGESLLWFTFWRCQNVMLEQMLPEGLWGERVKVTARVQVWYSDCSEEPFGPPLHSDCTTPWAGDLEMRVGAGSVHSMWTDDVYCNGTPCWHDIQSPWVDVPITGDTIWVQSRSDWPAKHENVYVESVTLEVWNE